MPPTRREIGRFRTSSNGTAAENGLAWCEESARARTRRRLSPAAELVSKGCACRHAACGTGVCGDCYRHASGRRSTKMTSVCSERSLTRTLLELAVAALTILAMGYFMGARAQTTRRSPAKAQVVAASDAADEPLFSEYQGGADWHERRRGPSRNSASLRIRATGRTSTPSRTTRRPKSSTTLRSRSWPSQSIIRAKRAACPRPELVRG